MHLLRSVVRWGALFRRDAPLYFYAIPAEQRDRRCLLKSDICSVDQQHFFVRGCLEIPVLGELEPFSWGVWVSLSADNFEKFSGCLRAPKRSHIGPFFGWLSAELPLYPSTASTCGTTGSDPWSSWSRPIIHLQSSNEMESRLRAWPRSTLTSFMGSGIDTAAD